MREPYPAVFTTIQHGGCKVSVCWRFSSWELGESMAGEDDEFARVLDRARRAVPEQRHLMRTPDITSALEPLARTAQTNQEPTQLDLEDLYEEHFGHYEKQLQTEPRVTRPLADQVASELNIEEEMSSAELHRIRRAFALANHPDRVPSEHREEATERMTIANALLDQALVAAKSTRR
jgi:hypothetical protein